MTDHVVDPTRRPTVVSGALAAMAALVAVVVGTAVSSTAVAIGLVGTLVFAVGASRGSRTAVDLGCLALFLGVVAGGIQGGSVERTLLATVATVFAWDLGGNAIDLGEQLGREADTRRLEAVHAGSSLLVGLSAATLGYAIYVFAADGQPASAVALLLVATLLVTLGLGASRRGWIGPQNRR
ncbi:DUF7519 family protein [Natronobeatus ordinarius]|uniref:DUF7519 family protein n=1 Tax=Natronobeatus ordinarius TaxID=2963433 RepID=UPI0020CEF6C1|nr:hypothetical protein [Natronobeatus ordinarius]